MTYAFAAGADPDTDEPAWDATVIPYLSDDSDATYLHFDGGTGVHDYLELYGDPAAVPSTPVTAISMTIRGRCSDPTYIVPYLYTGDFITNGYINYYGPDPALGIPLPVGSEFGEVTVTFDQAAADAALGGAPADWIANNGTVDWTTLEGFVDGLRAGFEMRWLYNGGAGTWDVSKFTLTFVTTSASGGVQPRRIFQRSL